MLADEAHWLGEPCFQAVEYYAKLRAERHVRTRQMFFRRERRARPRLALVAHA